MKLTVIQVSQSTMSSTSADVKVLLLFGDSQGVLACKSAIFIEVQNFSGDFCFPPVHRISWNMSGILLQYCEYYSRSCHPLLAVDGNHRHQELVDD